jgi:hypothetical protein
MLVSDKTQKFNHGAARRCRAQGEEEGALNNSPVLRVPNYP